MARESQLVKSILAYLQIQLNLKKIGMFMRLNSGKVLVVKGKCRSMVTLCPPGTPDIYVRWPGGSTLWIECKSDKGKLRPEQIAFRCMCAELGDAYILARRVEDVQGEV